MLNYIKKLLVVLLFIGTTFELFAAPPVVESTPPSSVFEDSLFNYLMIGSDIDGDVISWDENLSNPLPDWLSLSPVSDKFVKRLAGVAPFSGDNGDDVQYSQLKHPGGMVKDELGNFYFADTDNHVIRQINTSGEIVTFAGIPGKPDEPIDGTIANQATIKDPLDIKIDSDGNLYISTKNGKIYKITTDKKIYTFAYKNSAYKLYGLYIDENDVVYVVSEHRSTVYKVTANGTDTGLWKQLAGKGLALKSSAKDYNHDGDYADAGESWGTYQYSYSSRSDYAYYYTPYSIVVQNNILYVADTKNHLIRSTDISGTTPGRPIIYAGKYRDSVTSGDKIYDDSNYYSSSSYDSEGTATSSYLNNPRGLSIDSAGNLFFISGDKLKYIDTTEGTKTIRVLLDDQPISNSNYDHLYCDSDGSLYYSDYTDNYIRKYTNPLTLINDTNNTVVAGVGSNYDNTGADLAGEAITQKLGEIGGVVTDINGIVYVASEDKIYKITPSGTISTLAEIEDGQDIGKIAISSDGNYIFAPISSKSRVYRVDTSDGTFETWVGSGYKPTQYHGYDFGNAGEIYFVPQAFTNGSARLSAKMRAPTAVVIDGHDNLYILDSTMGRIYKVLADGRIYNYYGNGRGEMRTNSYGYALAISTNYSIVPLSPSLGSTHSSTLATLTRPTDIAINYEGTELYIADNNTIFKSTNTANNSIKGQVSKFDGALFRTSPSRYPKYLSINTNDDSSSDDLYFSSRGRVFGIDLQDINITHIAGTSLEGYYGDNGKANEALFDDIGTIATNSSGDIYVSDKDNNVIRKVFKTFALKGYPENDDLEGEINHTISLSLNMVANGDTVHHDFNLTIKNTNDVPTSETNSLTAIRDEIYHFRYDANDSDNSNFTFNDIDPTADTFQRLKIKQITTLGHLYLDSNENNASDDGETIEYNQIIPIEDINKIKYISMTNGTDSFNFVMGDGTGYSLSYAMNISIVDAIEMNSSTTTTIVENSTTTWDIDAVSLSRVPTTPIVYSLPTDTNNDNEYFDINSSTGVISFTNNPNFETLSSYLVVVNFINHRVNDINFTADVNRTVIVSLENLNEVTPTFANEGITDVVEYDLYRHFIDIHDPDSNNITLNTTKPDWLSLSDGSNYISRIAGTGAGGYTAGSVAALESKLYSPLGTAMDNEGNIYIVDSVYHTVRKIDTNGTMSIFAGVKGSSGSTNNTTATSGRFYIPKDVVVDNAGNVYIADYSNHAIRKIDTNGQISTFAGQMGLRGYEGDGGIATDAKLYFPIGLAIDDAGNIYVAEYGNHVIRKIDIRGNITTVVGTGILGASEDNALATNTRLYYPYDVAVDSSGNIYISGYKHIVQKVDTNGRITTIAGTYGVSGNSGDGGAAIDARFNIPKSIAVDKSGNIYIVDQTNHAIRKIDTNGTITTFAGINGSMGPIGDGGLATDARLRSPNSITFDKNDNLLISGYHVIRKVTSSTTKMLIGTPTVSGVYDVNLTIDDGDFNNTQNFQITVSDVNDNPDDLVAVDVDISDANATGSFVADINGTDEDGVMPSSQLTGGEVLTYSIIAGNTNNDFDINSTTGVITIVNELNVYRTRNYTLTVNIADDGGGNGTATVNVTVLETQYPPVTLNDGAITNEETPATISVLLNDTDVNLDFSIDNTSVTVTRQPTNGSVTISGTGVATYTPNNDFFGTDTFGYKVEDVTNLLSNEANVTIDVINTNDTPTITTINNFTLAEDFGIHNIGVDIADVDDDNLQIFIDINDTSIITATPMTDWITPNTYSSTVQIPIESEIDAFGVVAVTIKVIDGTGTFSTTTFNITVTATNDAPTAYNMAQLVGPNTQTLLSSFNPNFIDPEDDGMTHLRIDTNASQGSFQLVSDDSNISAPFEVDIGDLGNYKFNSSGLNHTSSDFNWSVKTAGNNNWSNSATGVVTIVSSADNDAPDVNITHESTSINGDIISIDEDTQTNPIYINFSDDYTPAQFLVRNIDSNDSTKVELRDINITNLADDNISIVIKPKDNVYGDVTINVNIYDGDKNGTKSFILRINSINDTPSLMNTEKTINEDTNYSFVNFDTTTIFLDRNDSVEDSGELNPEKFEILTLPAHGQLDLNDSNTPLSANTEVTTSQLEQLIYRPAENNSTDTNFTWKAYDGAIWTGIKTVTFNINEVNDVPTIIGTPLTTVDEDSSYSFTPTGGDIDSIALTYFVTNKPTWASFDSTTGELSGTPTNDDIGTTSDINISVTDSTTVVSLDNFNITVVNTNDNPTSAHNTIDAINNIAKIFINNDFAFSDIDPTSDTLVKIKISDISNIEVGTLKYSGTNVTLNQEIPIATISNLVFLSSIDGTSSFRFQVSDGTAWSIDYTMSMVVTSGATAHTLSNNEVDENIANIAIGTLNATPALGTTLGVWSFAVGDGVVDADNSLFSIDGSTLKLNVAANFEVKPTYKIRLSVVCSNGISSAKNFTITVVDKYEANSNSNSDVDGDGILDRDEGLIGLDTDNDGIPNYIDNDSDNDGVLDSLEGSADSDGDGILDYLDTDSDNDGISDMDEGSADSDGDGIPDYLDTDSDNDGVPDIDEGYPASTNSSTSGTLDSDGDGIYDYLDDDDDGDGISDIDEGANEIPPLDSDNDGIPNYKDTDADNDGILDINETSSDTDGDGILDYIDTDSDNDGILDRDEGFPASSDANSSGTLDTDGDGIYNWQDSDSDGDGIPDAIEGANEIPVTDTNGDGIPDYLDSDSDGDGVLDIDEGYPDTTNPNSFGTLDSDGDGIYDYEDEDDDGDGILDIDEGSNETPLLDSDRDGIPNYKDTDADNDGILDINETSSDTDNDGILDYIDTDSDGDGVLDIDEGFPASSDSTIIGAIDSDGDGIIDSLDTDDDGDGISDYDEGSMQTPQRDTDKDGIPDYKDTDGDNDGILDIQETGGVNPPVDTDGDGVPDYLDNDSDGNGVLDIDEGYPSSINASSVGVIDTDEDGEVNGIDTDDDNDGISDALEGVNETPLRDTDGDGIPDYQDTDTDGDGVLDIDEGFLHSTNPSLSGTLDSDGDGVADYQDTDDDGDGISDIDEGVNETPPLDSDNDGIPNYKDTDADNDGILDIDETTIDTDNDGISNYIDVDSDGDGILDINETSIDTDGNGVPDYLDEDSDGDGVSDRQEGYPASSDSTVVGTPDTDGDGILDATDTDDDNDGISDIDEGANELIPTDTDSDGIQNSLDTDSDNDGISDAEEFELAGGDATLDTDGDGIPDYIDTDTDGDGISDAEELELAGGDATLDTDGDGIPNYRDTNTDGDSIDDAHESTTIDSDQDGSVDYMDALDNRIAPIINIVNTLTIDLKENIALNSLTSEIGLALTKENGITIAWSSDNPTILSSIGIVTRDNTDTPIILTATVSYMGLSYDKIFILKILANMDDTQSVESTRDTLIIQNILGNNNNSSRIRSNLTLPTVGVDDSNISWSSDNPTIMNDDGTINRPSEDTLVTMTSTITKGDEEIVKTFQLLVKGTMTTVQKLQNAYDELSIDDILNSNRSGDTVINNIDLSTDKYNLEDGITLSFESNDTNILSNDGNITRTNKDREVTIVATFTDTNVEPNEIKTKNIIIFIKSVSQGTSTVTQKSMSEDLVDSRKRFRFNYDEDTDGDLDVNGNLTAERNATFTFIAEDASSTILTNENGDQASTFDNAAAYSKIKEVTTIFKNNGIIETKIQVRRSTDVDELDIKENIIKSELVDGNITREDDGSISMNVNLGTNNQVKTTSDSNGKIIQAIKKDTEDDSSATKIISNLRGSKATVKENGVVEILTPTLKVNNSGILNSGIRDIDIKLQSDANGSVSNEYTVQSDTNSSIKRKVKIDIPSTIKGISEVKDESTVTTATDTFMETKTLAVTGRIAVIYTAPDGRTKTKFMDTDGGNEADTSKSPLPFIPSDKQDVNIGLSVIDIDKNGEIVPTLRLTIQTPLALDETIEF